MPGRGAEPSGNYPSKIPKPFVKRRAKINECNENIYISKKAKDKQNKML